MTNEREERARAFYCEACEMPLPWMDGYVENKQADILAAMLAFADDELERAAKVADGQAAKESEMLAYLALLDIATTIRAMKGAA